MVILFDTYGSTDSRLHSVFLYHLEVCSASGETEFSLMESRQHNLKSRGSGLPYEFRFVFYTYPLSGLP